LIVTFKRFFIDFNQQVTLDDFKLFGNRFSRLNLNFFYELVDFFSKYLVLNGLILCNFSECKRRANAIDLFAVDFMVHGELVKKTPPVVVVEHT
jgi:hypothetical protein